MNSVPKVKRKPQLSSDKASFDKLRILLEDAAEMMFKYGTKIACPVHAKDQSPPRPVMACDHCEQQSENGPDGIVFMPKKYFLCRKCLALLNKRRFDLSNGLKVRCRECINATILRIVEISPSLCDDHSSS